MAKLLLVVLVCFLAAALTSCSESRPLSTDLTSMSTATDVIPGAGASTAAESGNVTVEQEGALTEPESKEFVEEFGPSCTEEDFEDSSADGGRPCHRILSDYGNPGANPNPKYP